MSEPERGRICFFHDCLCIVQVCSSWLIFGLVYNTDISSTEAIMSILPLLTAVAAFAGRAFFPLLINQKFFSTSRGFFAAKMTEFSKPLKYVDVSIP